MTSRFNILGSVNPGLPIEPKMIDISLIDADANNFYAADREKEGKRVELLAEEIMEVGFLSVIEVRATGNRYCVIAGETRLSAMKEAYAKTKDPLYQFIPCFIREGDDISNRRRLIMDNLLQRELTPGLKMQAIEELQKTYQEEKAAGKKLPGRIAYLIAQDMNMGKTQVGTYQTVINKGSEAVKEALRNEDITLEAAAKLSSLPQEEQEEFMNDTKDLSSEIVNLFVESKKSLEDDVYESTIYDYIDDEDIDGEDSDAHLINETIDEQPANDSMVLAEGDINLLAEVIDRIDYTVELECAKKRISKMQNAYASAKITDNINEMMGIIDVLKQLIS